MTEKSIKSGKKSKRTKPAKPTPDFPLTAHRNGQWCKKVGGKIYFFGVWEDSDKALKCWLDDKDSILAGRERPSRIRKGNSVEDICVAFLTFQEERYDQGEISRATLTDHNRVCKRICKAFGKPTPAESLIPEDFGTMKSALSKTLSPLSLGIEIQRIRSVFRFAYEDGLIEKPMRYGRQFEKPARKQITKQRNQRGKRMFDQAEIAKLLDHAEGNLSLTAFILLGLNCGFGNRDCALLPTDAVDLKTGWIEFPRPKTERLRRCPLWPETIAAMRAAKKARPQPKSEADENLFFITGRGECWVRNSAPGEGMVLGKIQERKESWIDSLGLAFRKLMIEADTVVSGRSFYGLRRTFRTIADETLDPVAIDRIMGHSADVNDMADHYRERIEDKRLKAVSSHVQKWVFAPQIARKK